MTKAAEHILKQAMELQPADQLEVAERLLEAGASAEISDDPEYLAAWEAEITRRLAAIDAGTSVPIPWERVRQQLLDQISRKKRSGADE